MEEEVSVSALPWSWVIEALAKSELVDTSFLSEFVSKVLPLSGGLGKQAREAAALRCLEGLFGPSDVLSENHVLSTGLKIGSDPTESCEAVLQHILSETSGSNGASDELKWDVQSFLKRKKACLPKSTLELLKNLILEDTHPLAASLKEFSGSAVCDQFVLNTPFDGGDPIPPISKSDEDDHVDKTMFAEENGCSPRSATDDQPVEAYANGTSLPCKGGTSNHHTDILMQASHDLDDQSPPGKKRKMDKEYGMKSMQPNSIPVGSNQMCGVDNGQYCEVLKTNRIHDVKLHRKDVEEQEKEYVGNHDEQQTSPNDSDHCREEIDLAMKNPNFLSTQCAFVRDPLDMTDTEPNLCMKCNKGGQLLSCSASSCPLLFHESCLGGSVSFDDQGIFYCPFCAYSRAISEYVKAKEKVCYTRKELSLFIGGKAGDQPEGLGHRGDTSIGDNVDQDIHENGKKRVEVEKGVNDRHKDVDKTTEVNKGVGFVAQVAKPHLSSFRGNQVDLSHLSAVMDVNGFVMATQQHVSSEDRQGAEVIIQLSRAPIQVWNQGQDDAAKLSDDNELRSHGETTRCKITELHGDASSESISNSDGLLQDKRNTDVGSLPSPTPLRAIASSRRRRRKKVPWTAEEEAMLKVILPRFMLWHRYPVYQKGIEMFVQQDRTIPWKNILEYGRSVFQKERTAMDLKDKWKRILRAVQPLK